jgi:hypothetical protein
MPVTPVITYVGEGQALWGRRDVLSPSIFDIRGDGYELRVLVAGSGSLGIGLRDRGLDYSPLMRLAGVTEIERRLAAGELPRENPDEGYIEILYTSDRGEELAALNASAKQCTWQVRVARDGLECDATPVGQERVTTLATCGACGLPDSRLLCSNLRHPTNLPVRTYSAGLRGRVAVGRRASDTRGVGVPDRLPPDVVRLARSRRSCVRALDRRSGTQTGGAAGYSRSRLDRFGVPLRAVAPALTR